MSDARTLTRPLDHQPMSMEKRELTRLRALFDECLVLMMLEGGRKGRDVKDWFGQCRRVADVLNGRDIYVRDTMRKLEEMMTEPVSLTFGFRSHVQRAREARFCQMVDVLEADGTLPLA